MKPLVTFLVPCYKLAHLLPECIESILNQTYENFEVLILDDCSPDNTPEVAQRFTDPRVRYIRHEKNLGHLRNYNAGIALAKGRYVWLISADDRLRKPYILERYVEKMEQHPKVGYIFCPAVGLEKGQETEVLAFSRFAEQDRVLEGHEFLPALLEVNVVPAASGMVRRECYERLGGFPLSMPYGGDWYLWCLFALYYDVAFLAEPMVCYRQHEGSMTQILMRESYRICMEDDLGVLWTIFREAQASNLTAVSSQVEGALVREYVRYLSGPHRRSPYAMTVSEWDESLEQRCPVVSERKRIRARILARLGDEAYWKHEPARAVGYYRASLADRLWNPRVLAKTAFLHSGALGVRFRSGLSACYRLFAASK
ncbi:MAG TPA: glycosyltransferase [Bryobacteraceae bacterium]|nr:glycosyltransferase [Bryobacteraceae bacterium]